MPPGDEESEEDVESAETCGQEPVAPSGWAEDGEAAEEHEAEAHDGDDLNRKCASSHDAGTVEQQPRCGERGLQAGTEQEKCQESSSDERRSESKDDFARGSGKQREAPPVCFPGARKQSNGDGEEALS